MSEQPLSVAEAARAHRVARQFGSGPVRGELLQELLDLANRAPISWDLNSRSIVAITGEQTLDDLLWAAEGAPLEAAAILAFTADLQQLRRGQLDPSGDPDADIWTTDSVSIFARLREYATKDAVVAAGFAMLVATGLGLATAPLTGWSEDRVKKILGIADQADVTVALLLAVGQPA